jgi:Na+-translocating ferredoxin:NAD+ oxidoreductase RnfD subunit
MRHRHLRSIRLASARTLTLGGTPYPLVLPNIRDPRLHVASVIITIHVLGQVGLHFRVSIPQILAAILACWVIEVVLTFRSARMFVWPASAMLTGSGVALILRVVGTPPDQPWYTGDWWVFAGVAAFALLTKYVIKYRGSHVFNPSNIGLVVAFIVLGVSRVEPLDFWWGPLTAWLAIAYAVILVGGTLITRRLKLLALAGTFWVALAAGLGVLAASGHCMTANWAFAPVCGVDYWRVIVTSPEVMIFLFFMITDPKTTPAGRVGRVLFGLLVAIVSVLLMAPQVDEWGTKVALLTGLVLVCAARPLIDRLVPEPKSEGDRLRLFAGRLVPRAVSGPARGVAGAGLAVLAVVVVGAGIVVAGAPARGTAAPVSSEALTRPPSMIDPATLPSISVTEDVRSFDHRLDEAGIGAVLVMLGQNLALENQALLERDAALLNAVDHGDRLEEMRGRLAEVEATGSTTVRQYEIESVVARLLIPFGAQTGLSLGLDASGTVTEEVYDAVGNLVSSETTPLEQTFAMRRVTGERWLNVGVFPIGSGGPPATSPAPSG